MARPTNTQFAVAVHLMTLLAAVAEESLSSDEMAASVGSNPVHVRRVLAGLRQAGLVTSRPGPGGGWQPATDPRKTTLAQVWRAANGADPVLGVHNASPSCEIGQSVHGELEEIDRRALAAIEAELEKTTVADLVRRAGPARGFHLETAS